MFDTIRLETPLVCPGCGHEEASVQTHHFGETLDTYRIDPLAAILARHPPAQDPDGLF